DEFRTKGDLLLAHVHTIEPGVGEVSLNDFQDTGKKITISLDTGISIVQNAQRFYRLYKKYKIDPGKVHQKITYLETRLKDIEEEQSSISLIEDPLCFYQVALDTLSDRDRSLSLDKSRRRSSGSDYLPILRYEWENSSIMVGLNSRGNRYLTFREARGIDLWFHIYEMPGAHVILKEPNVYSSPENREILLSISASLAAYHSKARRSGKARIIYTERKNVRAISGGDTAQVTYKNASSLLIDPFYWKAFLSEKE
ncbi:MAG TPA: NFACT family protein, partial [Synergistales bacterium]|nr:NFACT family protein [Synergistales bacterium]